MCKRIRNHKLVHLEVLQVDDTIESLLHVSMFVQAYDIDELVRNPPILNGLFVEEQWLIVFFSRSNNSNNNNLHNQLRYLEVLDLDATRID